jgi:hypothetical protein
MYRGPFWIGGVIGVPIQPCENNKRFIVDYQLQLGRLKKPYSFMFLL